MAIKLKNQKTVWFKTDLKGFAPICTNVALVVE